MTDNKSIDYDKLLEPGFYPHECGSMIECVTRQDALKAMQAAVKESQQGWIDVKERLPEDSKKHVQFYCDYNKCQYIGIYSAFDKAWFSVSQEIGNVSHWKEIGLPPADKKATEQ